MTMENKKNVPAIRFKGFTDIWIKRSFGEVGSVAMNRRIFKDQTSPDGEIPFYKIGTFGEKPDSYISRKLFEEYKQKYPYPQIGDILISASGSIGRLVEYKGADEYFQDSNIVWLTHDEQLSNLFLKYLYSIIKWNGLEGSTIKRLYNKNLLDTTFMIPNLECHSKSIEEQKAIGNYFQNIDKLIVASQTKLDKLKTIKKACFEKMFPKNGSTIPKLRFKGFAEEWKPSKLNEILRMHPFKPYLAKPILGGKYAIIQQGDNPIVGYANGEPFYDYKNVVLFGDQTLSFYKPRAPFFVATDGIRILSGNEVNDGDYLLCLLVQNRPNSEGYKRYYSSLINKQCCITINQREQIKIGRLFKTTDDLIVKTEQKIEKLKNIKKACLDKMFVNRED